MANTADVVSAFDHDVEVRIERKVVEVVQRGGGLSPRPTGHTDIGDQVGQLGPAGNEEAALVPASKLFIELTIRCRLSTAGRGHVGSQPPRPPTCNATPSIEVSDGFS